MISRKTAVKKKQSIGNDALLFTGIIFFRDPIYFLNAPLCVIALAGLFLCVLTALSALSVTVNGGLTA